MTKCIIVAKPCEKATPPGRSRPQCRLAGGRHDCRPCASSTGSFCRLLGSEGEILCFKHLSIPVAKPVRALLLSSGECGPAWLPECGRQQPLSAARLRPHVAKNDARQHWTSVMRHGCDPCLGSVLLVRAPTVHVEGGDAVVTLKNGRRAVALEHTTTDIFHNCSHHHARRTPLHSADAHARHRSLQVSMHIMLVHPVLVAWCHRLVLETLSCTWWTSRSITRMRCRPNSSRAAAAATAMSLKMQKPSPRPANAWCVPPGQQTPPKQWVAVKSIYLTSNDRLLLLITGLETLMAAQPRGPAVPAWAGGSLRATRLDVSCTMQDHERAAA